MKLIEKLAQEIATQELMEGIIFDDPKEAIKRIYQAGWKACREALHEEAHKPDGTHLEYYNLLENFLTFGEQEVEQ